MATYEGKLRILRIDKAPVYWIMFLPYHTGGGAIPRYVSKGKERLRQVLTDLDIDSFIIDQALENLDDKGESAIDHVVLSTDQIRRYGLGELGVLNSIRTYIGSL